MFSLKLGHSSISYDRLALNAKRPLIEGIVLVLVLILSQERLIPKPSRTACEAAQRNPG
jgi:hypothetical protein